VKPSDPVQLLYDGACPFCAKGACWLGRRDGAGRLRAVDIQDPAFDPARFGLSREEAGAGLHAVLPDGRVVSRMEAVRAAWGAIGLGWILAPTRWRVIRPLFDTLYTRFARSRSPLRQTETTPKREDPGEGVAS
jgi:predicted DCC family thiol-disulfide oxidoreductase YuxK